MTIMTVDAAHGGHHIHFFDTDESLAKASAGHLNAALLDGETAIVLATPAHGELVTGVLAAAGLDVTGAVEDGRLALHDAATVLARFTTDGAVDATRFEEAVGGLVRPLAGTGRPVRGYGEMVALLWEAGDVTGAMDLEGLWNELGATLPSFSLFCAYPAHLFRHGLAAEAFPEICRLHSGVSGGAPPAPDSEVNVRFAHSALSPRLARCFVADMLERWARDDLIDDALLVVTELTTNSVVHARSDVSVGLGRRDSGTVRLVVGDRSAAAPAIGAVHPTALGGRGLRMIDEVARSWGHAIVEGGKLVWVDLGPAVERRMA